MSLPPLPLAPMEAIQVDALPADGGWQYEPKWDGFRCIAARIGRRVTLQSKAQKPLARYFPDVERSLAALPGGDVVLDGELLIPVDGVPSFDALQLRLHPAASRVNRLAAQHPAILMLFDLLGENDQTLLARPLRERRTRLEAYGARHLDDHPEVQLSPATTDVTIARQWLAGSLRGLDGVIAKQLALPYQPGERVMRKVKRMRTADCVVGGFRYATAAPVVASLLLGLYDDGGLLHHVGHTSGLRTAERPQLTARLEQLIGPPGFTGNSPGGPSRWSTERSGAWTPVQPTLVVEVAFDHVTAGRMRHGARLVRWRPDKDPSQCRLEQLEQVDAHGHEAH